MPSSKPNSDLVMPLGAHLDELRLRLIHAIYGLVPIAAISLYFGKHLLDFLLQPLFHALGEAGYGAPQATGPLETFGAYMKVSLIAALLVGGPWILWQAWKFVSPGLYAREKRFVYFLLPLSCLFTFLGVFFLYRLVMPMMLTFFLAFGSDIGVRPIPTVPIPAGVTMPALPVLEGDPAPADLKPGMYWINKPMHEVRFCIEAGESPVIFNQPLNKDAAIRQDYRITEYISLLLSMMLAFAVSFQTPVIVLLLGWAGIVDNAFLAKYRKYALFLTSIIAALLTPGDVASMLMLWVPLYFLYELGGLLLRIMPASRLAGSKESPDAAA